MKERVTLLGCPVDLLTSKQLLDEIGGIIDNHAGPKVIQFVNANKVAQVREDPEMGCILQRADYVLTDGQPLVPMARLLGISIPERIDGIGLMGKLLALANRRGYRIYLLGAKSHVLEACVRRISREFPGLRIAGYRDGYFSAEEIGQVVAEIRQSNADLLFLGMGTPMKERFADRHAHELGVQIVQGVGGSFDVMAGLVKRAPVWMQRLCLEWLFRVLQEPRRMFWRYATTNTRCFLIFMSALWNRDRVLKFLFSSRKSGIPRGTGLQ